MNKKIVLLLIITLLFSCEITEVPEPDMEYVGEVTFVNNSSYDLTIKDDSEYYFETVSVPANDTVVQGLTEYFYDLELSFYSGDKLLKGYEHILVDWDDETVTIDDLPYFEYTFVNNSSYDITIQDASISNTLFEDFVLTAGTTKTIRITLNYIPTTVYLLEWEASGNEMSTMLVDDDTLTYTFIDM